MNENDKTRDEAVEKELEGVPEEFLEKEGAAGEDGSTEDALASLVADLEAAQKETLYAKAEVQNVRRRMEKDIQDARAYAATGFARDVLAIADNLERALDHALAIGDRGVEAAAEIITHLGEAWHELGTGAFARTQRTAAALPPGSAFRGWLTYWDYRCTWDTQVDNGVVLAALQRAETELRSAADPAPLAALLGYGTDLGLDIGQGPEWGVARAQEALALARELDQDWLLVQALSACARATLDAHDVDAARRHLAEGKDVARRLKDVHRLDLLTLAEAGLVARDGRREEAWALACGAVAGLLATRHDGTLFTACSRLAPLVDARRPAAAATLTGIGLAALDRMGSIPAPPDLERQYVAVAGAAENLGHEDFDRLLADGRALAADDAVAWVLDLVADPTPA